jgi:hypothetical protein
MLLLGSRDHVMENAVDEVLNKSDVGWLVMVATHSVGTDDSSVGIPCHGTGDVDE